MNFLKQLKKPKVRASTESSLVASANIPNSGLRFVDNSQGCSAAVAELSNLLDVALEKFDYEGEPSDQLQQQLKRLYQAAAKYTNSHLDGARLPEDWNCSFHDAEIICAAFACAAAVYDREENPSIPRLSFEGKEYITPSASGTIKATSITLVKRSAFTGAGHEHFLPMLVVAIRGTASRVDHMVNLNGDSREFNILDPNDLATYYQPVHAHAGFLNSAEALTPTLSKHIEDAIRKRSIKHVLFTGHSAGGAVASLLLAKYLTRAAEDYPSMKFSSISFGGPPVTRPSLQPYIFGNSFCKAENRGLVLSIVNEYDLVPRVDGAYVRSIVDLYRSIYNLPPIQDDDVQQERPTFQLPRFSFDTRTEPLEKDQESLWTLPKPIYWHIGKIVVLKVKLVQRDRGGSIDDELLLSAVTVSPESFAKLLFCNVAVHKKSSYRERMNMLFEGRFNGREKWE